MKPSNIPPFYVGQKVEAITVPNNPNCRKTKLIKGDHYTVIQVRKGCCQWEIEIGHSNESLGLVCSVCGDVGLSKQCWYMASRFRPITESFQTVSFSKVAEEAMCGVN